MESDPQGETSSLLVKQSPGTCELGTKSNKNSFASSSSGNSNSSGFTTNNKGSYVNGEKLETPLDEEILEKSFGDDENDTPASGSSTGLSVLESLKSGLSVAKVMEDRNDNEVIIEEEGSGEYGCGMDVPIASEEAPTVDEEKREGEYCKAQEVGGGEVVGYKADEAAALDSTNVDIGGIESINEGDAVVESINVDVGEGVAVFGVEDEKQDSYESIDTGDREEKVLSEVKGLEQRTSIVEEPSLKDSASVEGAGVKLTDDGDVVVDSIQIDDVEAVRYGVAVIGDVKEREGSGTEFADPLIEDSASKVEVKPAEVDLNSDEEKATGEGDSEFKGTEERTSDVEQPSLEDSAPIEGAAVKLTAEGDAVVDSIHIDAVEAVRSGVAVVGDVDESKGSEFGNTAIDNARNESANEGDAVIETIKGNLGKEVAAVGVEDEKQNSYESIETGDREEKVLSEVKGTEERTSIVEEPSFEDSASVDGAGVKLTDDGDVVVNSIQIDAVEAVRSGVAAVGDAEESKGLESENTAMDDSVIDGVNADAEAARTVVAVVGGSGASEFKNEFKEEQPLLCETPSKIVNGANEQNEEAVVDTEETNSKVDESKQHVSGDGVRTLSHEKGEEAGKRLHVPQELAGVSDCYGDDGEVDLFKDEVASRNFAEAVASGDRSEMIDGEVVTDSEEEEADSDEEGEGRELIDSTALAALLKAATSSGGSESGTITVTSQDGSRLFSIERPAGIGTSLRSARPPSNSSIFAPPNVAAPTEESLSEEDTKKLQKVHDLRVKFLRLVQRLGQTADQSVAAQVLYKLAILAGRTTFPSFSLDNAKQKAAHLEAEGKDDLDFSLNIWVLGKTGVGKSATINSIFGEEKVKINAFEPQTTSINLVSGTVDGVKLRVIDAPGLKISAAEQGFNCTVLASMKKYTQKFPPDIMLYVDRLDSQTRDLNDLPILRTITSSLGTSIWRSAILTLTHAACATPDGPSGAPLGYEVFVRQRCHIIQKSIGQVVGDLRFMNLSMMNPVSLVENHPACRKNREGQKVLPNGQAWRPQLLLMCYSLKILADASLISKPQDPVDHRKLFGFRVRSPPLSYLLSSLLQPRTHPKLSADQGGDNGDSDIDLEDFSDTDQEEDDDEYDQLPSFKTLKKTQIAKLSREQMKAYYDEYDYRVKLIQKKQWRDELKRMREMKNGRSILNESSEMLEDNDGENGAPAAVPVPLPDMVLPPSFDSDSPAYRYRFLEPTSQFLARPVLDTHGWDHDCGYDGVNVEHSLGIAGRYPAAVTVQVTKDKKDFNIHLDSAVSAKHSDNGSSLVGFDIQTIGKQLAYIVRGESKFKTMKRNKTTGGVSVTFLGENVATGVKLDDQLALGKRLVLVGTAGTVLSQKDAAYGSNLEVRLKDADYPIGQDQSSFMLSLMKWRGDLAIGGNLQSHFSVGRSSKVAVRVALNNKQSGQISVKTNSSDNLALAYVGLIPIAFAIYRKFRPSASDNYSLY